MCVSFGKIDPLFTFSLKGDINDVKENLRLTKSQLKGRQYVSCLRALAYALPFAWDSLALHLGLDRFYLSLRKS